MRNLHAYGFDDCSSLRLRCFKKKDMSPMAPQYSPSTYSHSMLQKILSKAFPLCSNLNCCSHITSSCPSSSLAFFSRTSTPSSSSSNTTISSKHKNQQNERATTNMHILFTGAETSSDLIATPNFVAIDVTCLVWRPTMCGATRPIISALATCSACQYIVSNK